MREAKGMAEAAGHPAGCRYLTARELDTWGGKAFSPQDETLAAGIDWCREQLEFKRQRGFSLIELCIAMTVSAILLSLAAPSFLNHYLREQLQTQVVSLEHGLLSTPALPLDATWTFVAPSTYSKTFAAPTAGTLQVVAPVTAGGSFTCVWGGNVLIKPRC